MEAGRLAATALVSVQLAPTPLVAQLETSGESLSEVYPVMAILRKNTTLR